jgi:hypothetical protein
MPLSKLLGQVHSSSGRSSPNEGDRPAPIELDAAALESCKTAYMIMDMNEVRSRYWLGAADLL